MKLAKIVLAIIAILLPFQATDNLFQLFHILISFFLLFGHGFLQIKKPPRAHAPDGFQIVVVGLCVNDVAPSK